MPQLRLLHISDLHIGRRRLTDPATVIPAYCPHVPTIANALAKFCYDERDNYDALVISGDLSHSGNERDLARAKRFVFAPAGTPIPWVNEGSPTLSASEKPIVLLPGNHDRYQGSVTQGMPGGVKFDSYFRSVWNAGLGGVQPTPLPDDQNPTVVLVAADFCLATEQDARPPGKFARHGQGKVYAKRLANLHAETAKMRQRYLNAAVIWLVHFAPEFEAIVQLDSQHQQQLQIRKELRLCNSERLCQPSGPTNAPHILCGHTHHRLVYAAPSNRSVRVHCAGTACCKGNRTDTSIHLLTVHVESGQISDIRQLDLEWRSNVNRFVPVELRMARED